MEYKINEIPFKMDEISAKLFNLEYLSDVTFIVEGNNIYAHSLILMLRSSTFQKQLEATVGEKKIIPITDYGYDAFYQLIRFIYTDQVEYKGRDDLYPLLKLAKRYNIIRLVNHLLNARFSDLNKFNFCVIENHKIGLNFIKIEIADDLKWFMDSDSCLSIQPETIEEILKFEQINKSVTESYILDVLVRWMNHYCEQNQIPFAECCQKFANLIRSVRFPTMSTEELRNIKTKYPDLLMESDFMKFAILKIYGAEYDDGIWNCSPRTEFVRSYEWRTYPNTFLFQTKFSVSSPMILDGFVVGLKFNPRGDTRTLKTTISCDGGRLNATNINYDVDVATTYAVINLGTSICVRPNFIYTIGYKYELMDNVTEHRSRKSQTELKISAPPNSVKILEAHATMFEILLYPPEGSNI